MSFPPLKSYMELAHSSLRPIGGKNQTFLKVEFGLLTRVCRQKIFHLCALCCKGLYGLVFWRGYLEYVPENIIKEIYDDEIFLF